MRCTRWIALVAALLLVNAADAVRPWLVAEALAQAAVVTPMPVPDGFGFPTDAATINGWVANADIAAMRGHAWNLWAAMTAKSGQVTDGGELPIWETWLGTEDLFPPPSQAVATLSGPALLRPRQRALRVFVQPLQFHHNRLLTSEAAAVAAGTNVVSFNKFDPEAASFIVAPQPGPGGATFAYNQAASLNKLNQAWPAGTTGANRAINEFPIRGIETKPVFQLVKATGLTALPLWQGTGGATNNKNPTPDRSGRPPQPRSPPGSASAATPAPRSCSVR
jgi:hypothetical protein